MNSCTNSLHTVWPSGINKKFPPNKETNSITNICFHLHTGMLTPKSLDFGSCSKTVLVLGGVGNTGSYDKGWLQAQKIEKVGIITFHHRKWQPWNSKPWSPCFLKQFPSCGVFLLVLSEIPLVWTELFSFLRFRLFFCLVGCTGFFVCFFIWVFYCCCWCCSWLGGFFVFCWRELFQH